MIRGIGTDIVKNARIGAILDRPYADRFVARVLSAQEREMWKGKPVERRVTFLAGRWAAKESLVKAFGIRELQFQNITLRPVVEPPATSGPLTVDLGAGNLCLVAARHGSGPVSIHVSISHEDDFTVAFSIIQAMN